MKLIIHSAIALGVLLLQLTAQASLLCGSSLGLETGSCCCSSAAPVENEVDGCCSAEEKESAPVSSQDPCSCSLNPYDAIPFDSDTLFSSPSPSDVIHTLSVTVVDMESWSLQHQRVPYSLDTGPPGGQRPVYQLNCVYLR